MPAWLSNRGDTRKCRLFDIFLVRSSGVKLSTSNRNLFRTREFLINGNILFGNWSATFAHEEEYRMLVRILIAIMLTILPAIFGRQSGQVKPTVSSPPEVKKTVEAIIGVWKGQLTA